MFALVEVPEHSDTVLATGRGQGAIWRDGDGVDVARVAIMVGLQLELGKVPNLLKVDKVRVRSKDKSKMVSEILVEM